MSQQVWFIRHTKNRISVLLYNFVRSELFIYWEIVVGSVGSIPNLDILILFREV